MNFLILNAPIIGPNNDIADLYNIIHSPRSAVGYMLLRHIKCRNTV